MNNVIHADASCDLGEAGCGDLALGLRRAVLPLAAGEIIAIRAIDKGAKADIASWCNLTGNELLAGPAGEDGVTYYVRKKGS